MKTKKPQVDREPESISENGKTEMDIFGKLHYIYICRSMQTLNFKHICFGRLILFRELQEE